MPIYHDGVEAFPRAYYSSVNWECSESFVEIFEMQFCMDAGFKPLVPLWGGSSLQMKKWIHCLELRLRDFKIGMQQ